MNLAFCWFSLFREEFLKLLLFKRDEFFFLTLFAGFKSISFNLFLASKPFQPLALALARFIFVLLFKLVLDFPLTNPVRRPLPLWFLAARPLKT